MAVQIQDVTFGYDGRQVLHGITMNLDKGTFTVILGKNGSGKSTLFRLIAGILQPWSGQISLSGVPVHNLTLKERARILGFLAQHHRPVFPFRVRDVVLTGRAGRFFLSPSRKDSMAAVEAMARIGIGHLQNRLFTELSGGEQQMVMIARVLAQNPTVILFDEPTSHLDFYYQAKVMGIIVELVDQGFTVAAILHDPNLAFMYGRRFYYLKDGRLLPSDPESDPTQLLENVYGMDLEMIHDNDRKLIIPRQ